MTFSIIYPDLESYVNGYLNTTNVVRSMFDANTILKADVDDTPVSLTITEQTFVGRLTGGTIAALDYTVTSGQVVEASATGLTAANLIAPASNILTLTATAASTLALNITAAKTLTLTATDNYTLTIPATGTAALLETANVFTQANTFNGQIFANASYATKLTIGGLPGSESVYAGVWLAQASPDTTNYLLLGSAADSYINAPSGHLYLLLGNSIKVDITSTLMLVNNIMIFANAKSIQWKDSGGTVRNVFQYFSDNNLYIDNAAGNFVFRPGGSQKSTMLTTGYFALGAALTPLRRLHVMDETATTADIINVQRIEARSTGTPAAGFGAGLEFYAETATTSTYQQQALIASSWVDATNATRKADLTFSAYDTAQRKGLTIAATGSDVTLLALGKLAFTQTDLNEYIDSLADGYMDYRATTAHRFGDGTNYLNITGSGLTSFVGTAGLYAGHMYTNTTITVSIADSNPTEVGDTWTTGEVNGVSFGSAHYLDVGANGAGKYLVTWGADMAQNTPSAAIVLEMGIMVNGTAQAQGKVTRNVANSTDIGAVASTAILDLAANAQVSLYVANLTNTTDIDIDNANVTIVQIIGT